MVLTIDSGNTSTKLMIFDDTAPVYRETLSKLTLNSLRRVIGKFPPEHVAVSSVGVFPAAILKWLRSRYKVTVLTGKSKVPVKIGYKSPATLGPDRLAAVIAANFLFPRKNILVVDIGTCITYDIVTAEGIYKGGNISPGMHMRFKALHAFTEKLPLVGPADIKVPEGVNTVLSIQSGVILGIVNEISGFISLYGRKYKSLKVILTGGDSGRFAGQLKLPIFAAADLVNLGLNVIVRNNVAGK